MSISDYHINFTLAAEYREKIRRTKEDFGQPGCFFCCETFRGIFDFPVLDANYFEKESFNPLDVILIDGRVSMKTGRVLLQPFSFRRCDESMMDEAEKLIEFGYVHGNVRVARDSYERREDGALIPRVECKGMGFVDQFVDQRLFNELPTDSPIKMSYSAQISLDMAYERRDNNLQKRNAWVLTGQKVEPIRPTRRPADRREEVKAA